MSTFYLFKTNSGVVYDRTRGKNKRLYFNSKYIIRPHGSFIVRLEEDERIYIERYDKFNTLIYKREMAEVGMYVCGEIYAKLAKKTNKNLKSIEHYLTAALGRDYYTLNLGKDLLIPIKLQMKIWQDGTIRYAFFVNLDEKAIDDSTQKIIEDKIERLASVDLNRFIMQYMSYCNNATMFTINDDFFDLVKSLGIQERNKLQRTGS